MIADTFILALPKVSFNAKQMLPEKSGIYYVLDEVNTVWYIGQAKNLRKRWQGKAHHRIYQLEKQKQKHFCIYYELVDESQLTPRETEQIQNYHPHLNASPVKRQIIHPTETLLRETLSAIADFAFILGVELPRREIASQCGLWYSKRKALDLKIIHIVLDKDAIVKRFQPKDKQETKNLVNASFKSRKTYASKWDFDRNWAWVYRLCVQGYAIEVSYWERWYQRKDLAEIREYTTLTLAQEPIRVLTPNYVQKLKSHADLIPEYGRYLNRIEPYTSDLIPIIFNESFDREGRTSLLKQISSEYREGKRGLGTRDRDNTLKKANLKTFLDYRGIDCKKYSKSNCFICQFYTGDKVGVFVQSFDFDFKTLKTFVECKSFIRKLPVYNVAVGCINNSTIRENTINFETVYLAVGVDRLAWLLVEEYLQDFAKPAIGLNEGEGYIEKCYASPRKFIVPAKMSLKIESIGCNLYIPFGSNPQFPTFESATTEIKRRLTYANLPEFKVSFTRETTKQ